MNRSISLFELQQQFGAFAVRATNLAPVMRAGGLMGLSETRQRLFDGKDVNGAPFAALRFPRPQGGDRPLQNTGMLGGSLTSTFDAVSFRVGTTAKQAALMNFGGTVVPVTRKWLTIPLTKEAIYAGSARNMTGLRFRMLGTRAACLERVEPVTPKKKKGVTVVIPNPGVAVPNSPAFQQPKGTGTIVRHWLLVKEVHVPARMFVGTSDMLLFRVKLMLVHYLQTGSL